MSVNPILLQKTIRDNAADLQDFAKDLKSWGAEMKRKEETLRNENQTSLEAQKVAKDSKHVKKLKGIDDNKKLPTKIGATDYAAWDKFDANAELNKLEEDINDDSELTDECNENMYDEAIVEKEKGNKFVKAQKWKEAISCYTKAIKSYSYDPVFYANRALCYLKLSKFTECEEDCNISIKLDDTYVKAYQRRAAARVQLKKLEHAEIDLKKVLVIEPKNREAKTELDKLNILLKRNKTEVPDQRPVSKFTASRIKSNTGLTIPYQPPKDLSDTIIPEKLIDDSTPLPLWTVDPEIIEVKAIKKPPHLQSKKPLKRIEITEIDDIQIRDKIKTPTVEEPLKKFVLEKTQSKEKLVELTSQPVKAFKKNKIELLEEKTVTFPPSPEIIEECPKQISLFKKQKSEKLGETNFNSHTPNPENKLDFLKTEDLKIVEKTTPKDVKNTVNGTKKLTESNEINFIYPKSSVQFYSSWKNFSSTEDKYKYLKLIDPKDFPKIFLNSLDSILFSNILDVMVKHFIERKDKIYDILNCLSEVKRFSAITMFMNGEDKNNLWKLFDHIKEMEEKEKEDVDKLIMKYEL